nr:tyrosine-type recombinase/integrase [Sphingomonas sp. dw_22]
MTAAEINAFLKSARSCDIGVNSFCLMLALTGCRISEALSLTRENIDFEAEHVIIQSLKKRGKRIFRAIPLPSDFLNLLKTWFRSDVFVGDRLWPWSRMTGYRRICEVMRSAGVSGSYATPKGLRHGFAVHAVQTNVPLTLIQRWLGHADIKTTAIYTSAIGPEEREIAARMWNIVSKRDSRHLKRHLSRSRPEGHDADEHFAHRPASCSSCNEISITDAIVARPADRRKSKAITMAYRINGIFYCSLIQFWLNCHRFYADIPYI